MHEKFFNKLNDEQKDIVKLVKQGLTNIEIGVELGYSADSIKKRLSVIYKKFGVRKRIELIDLISWYHTDMIDTVIFDLDGTLLYRL